MPLRTLPASAAADERPAVHPAWVRAAHWVNVAAVAVMVASGWRIYNASPLWPFRFPAGWTLGGWLGGALQWHFAGMWLLVANGAVYVALNLASGRFARRFLPLRAGALVRDLVAALHGRLAHDDLRQINALQRAAYLVAVALLALLVLSGLVLWKSVQLPWLRELLGGYETARQLHFAAMALLVTFVAGHVAMALIVPRSLVAMLRGR